VKRSVKNKNNAVNSEKVVKKKTKAQVG